MAEDETRRVVTLHGDIDSKSAPEVRTLLLDAVEHDRELCVDMSEVSHVDSAGIACLLEAHYAADAKGVPFSLANVGDTGGGPLAALLAYDPPIRPRAPREDATGLSFGSPARDTDYHNVVELSRSTLLWLAFSTQRGARDAPGGQERAKPCGSQVPAQILSGEFPHGWHDQPEKWPDNEQRYRELTAIH